MLAANIVVATMLMRKPPRTLRARRPHQTGCSLGISNASTPNRMHCSPNYFFHLPCFCSSHCQSPNSPCSKSGTFSPIDNLSLIYLSLGGKKKCLWSSYHPPVFQLHSHGSLLFSLGSAYLPASMPPPGIRRNPTLTPPPAPDAAGFVKAHVWLCHNSALKSYFWIPTPRLLLNLSFCMCNSLWQTPSPLSAPCPAIIPLWSFS